MNTLTNLSFSPVTAEWIGRAAIAQAGTAGRNGGPGFEFGLIRECLDGTNIGACRLTREPAEIAFGAAYSNSWDWRLYDAQGHCVAQRLTPQ